MKMSNKRLGELMRRIALLHEDLPARAVSYERQGLTPKRFRWDVLWVVDRESGGELVRSFYADGLNDEHIDTALRSALRIISSWAAKKGE